MSIANFYLSQNLFNEVSAAWIQALGTIIAIFVAIYIARREHKNSVLLAKNICINKMKNIYEIAEVAIDVNESIILEITQLNNQYKFIRYDGLKDLIAQLEKAPIYELDNSKFSTRVIRVIRNLRNISDILNEINNNQIYTDDLINKIKNSSNLIKQSTCKMNNIITSLVNNNSNLKKEDKLMDKKYAITILAITFIFVFLTLFKNEKYTFQVLEGREILVGNTKTGEAWICMDTLTHTKMKETETYRKELPKDFNGCLSFTSPKK